MKINVQDSDGNTELIDLVPPIKIASVYGTCELTWIHCADGTDHFFNLDGDYDGSSESGYRQPENATCELCEQPAVVTYNLRGTAIGPDGEEASFRAVSVCEQHY